MPRTRFDKVQRDPLKELVLGRKAAIGMTATELAEKACMSRTRYGNMMREHSNTWRISDVLAFSSVLDIPMAEMREAVGKK